jgi:nicotinamidase-related amidase
MKRVDLFVIDGENDFCASGTEPQDWPWPVGGRRRGSLFVEGADKEAVLVADMIKRLKDSKVPSGHRISKIHATLDAHHRNDGSHNTAWKDSSGACPPPFTVVTHADVVQQKYVPRFAIGVFEGKTMPSYQWALKYTEALEKHGRCPLCLWPPHCEIGTWGGSIYHPLQMAYDDWCAATNGWIDFISKGHWPFTEHYSAMRADVPDPTRPETQLNVGVIQDAAEADIVAWTGWAGSHCLRWTALDAVNYFGQGQNDFIKKSVFFTDASAAVPNIPNPTNNPAIPKFSDWRQEFLDEVQKRGGQITTTKEFLK